MDPDTWDRITGLIVGGACASGAWAFAAFAVYVFSWLPLAVDALRSMANPRASRTGA